MRAMVSEKVRNSKRTFELAAESMTGLGKILIKDRATKESFNILQNALFLLKKRAFST